MLLDPDMPPLELPAMPPLVPLPVVGALEGRVPALEPEPVPVPLPLPEFEALLPVPHGRLLVPMLVPPFMPVPLLTPEPLGDADGLEFMPPPPAPPAPPPAPPPPAPPPAWAKAKPVLPAISAAVKIASVGRVFRIRMLLGFQPRRRNVTSGSAFLME
jgi:hypothetical protein